jgi:hypothetical protein
MFDANGGSSNSAFGANSLSSNSGSDNSAFGNGALYNNTSGNFNTGMGYSSLDANSTGNRNTGFGFRSLNNNSTGSNNTALGDDADVATGDLNNAMALGSGAIVSESNQIQLGNSSVENVKTSGTITAGTVTYPKEHGASGQVLSTSGSGLLTWINASSPVPTYTIGLNADLGGYVFYVTPDGKHGLVAATQDQSSTITWYDAQDNISNPANHNANGKKFTDWRMPTKYELSLIADKHFLDIEKEIIKRKSRLT